MKLYIESLKMHFKSLLEYRVSFVVGFFSQFLIFFTYYFIIIALFTKFDNIKGFTLYEVLLTFSIIQFGFSVNEFLARGVDTFETLIIDGSLDRLLVRPRNILLQVLCSKADFVKISRILQDIVILLISLHHLNIEFTFLKLCCLILMLISAVVIFFAVFLLMASFCFVTVQALEVKNLFTDGGKHVAQYPIGVFKKGIVMFFTFIIPYGFVNYYPLLYLLGKTENVLYCFSPIIVLIYVIPAFIAFKYGLKKYTSAGG